MTGIIIVSKGKSLDVRTIDFDWIVESLREQKQDFPILERLLRTVDEFGMDMICADELTPSEFSDFQVALERILTPIGTKSGIGEFLKKVLHQVDLDTRSRTPPSLD
jgi:hypothetical protein